MNRDTAELNIQASILRRNEQFVLESLTWSLGGYSAIFRQGQSHVLKTGIDEGTAEDPPISGETANPSLADLLDDVRRQFGGSGSAG
jgi:hypothetical protein